MLALSVPTITIALVVLGLVVVIFGESKESANYKRRKNIR